MQTENFNLKHIVAFIDLAVNNYLLKQYADFKCHGELSSVFAH